MKLLHLYMWVQSHYLTDTPYILALHCRTNKGYKNQPGQLSSQPGQSQCYSDWLTDFIELFLISLTLSQPLE